MKNKIFSLVITLILTANAGFCTQTRTVAISDLMIKFVIAMVGVMLASIIIWAGLAVYNKILSNQKPAPAEEETLKTPKTIDEAVKFFISKNRPGFGAIDLLIGLLITTAIFMIGMNAMKGIKLQTTPADTQSIQEHVDAKVNEIEQMRQQSIDFQNDILKEAQ